MHFSRFMVEGDEKLLFISDIDGEVVPHIERLVESAGPVFDAVFEHVDDPPPTPVASDPRRVVKWLRHHVREPLDTYFAYEDASVQDIKAYRAQRASSAIPAQSAETDDPGPSPETRFSAGSESARVTAGTRGGRCR